MPWPWPIATGAVVLGLALVAVGEARRRGRVLPGLPWARLFSVSVACRRCRCRLSDG
ncbi:hypothetical protein [Alloactinosynnema sp. L-07]|nr:hypothetical protein [Alloactinosynnema sp. L-07]